MQWQACRRSTVTWYRSNGSISIEKCSAGCSLHPSGTWAARGHVQRPSRCVWPSAMLMDVGPCLPPPPAAWILGGEATFVGKLPGQRVQDWGYGALKTGTPGCSDLGRNSDPLLRTGSAWQLRVEARGLFSLLLAIASLSLSLSPASQKAEGRREGRGKSGHGCSS